MLTLAVDVKNGTIPCLDRFDYHLGCAMLVSLAVLGNLSRPYRDIFWSTALLRKSRYSRTSLDHHIRTMRSNQKRRHLCKVYIAFGV